MAWFVVPTVPHNFNVSIYECLVGDKYLDEAALFPGLIPVVPGHFSAAPYYMHALTIGH
jgi:hypothetical protein